MIGFNDNFDVVLKERILDLLKTVEGFNTWWCNVKPTLQERVHVDLENVIYDFINERLSRH